MNDTRKPLIAINTLAIPGPRLGGGYSYVSGLLPRLVAAAPGARFAILASEENRRYLPLADNDVHWTMLDSRVLRGTLRTVIARHLVPSWLQRMRADLYFVPHGWLPVRVPCPTVWTFQNMLLLDAAQEYQTTPMKAAHRLRQWMRRQAISRVLLPAAANADRIIAVSRTAQDGLTAHFPNCRERVRVIYEGVDTRFTPDGDKRADAAVLSRWRIDHPYYLTVSTLMRHKQYEPLIKAFAKFKSESDTPSILVIAGDDWGGFRRRLERLVERLGAAAFIRFLGHVEAAELPALYRQARSFILLSTCESFGMPAVEAMACGCPTIVAGQSGSAEIVGDGGVRLDPFDINAVSGLLHELDVLVDQRAALARSGVARAAQFSWSTAARQTAAIFAQLLNRQISPHDIILDGQELPDNIQQQHEMNPGALTPQDIPVGIE